MVICIFQRFLGFKRKYVYDHYVYFGDFPIPIDLLSTEKQKCPNSELKSKGKFLIFRDIVEGMDDEQEAKFRAVLPENKENEMSYADSELRGTCDDVFTHEQYQGCGLAKYLVATCFQDEMVLGKENKGLDVKTDGHWKYAIDQRNDVVKYCETITFLRCLPWGGAPNTAGACVSYLRAGFISDFQLLFTGFSAYRAKKTLSVFELGEKFENDFKVNADVFVKENGRSWFFCKCKENEKKGCMQMLQIP